MDRLPVSPGGRKPAGIALILLLIAGWAIAVASAAPLLDDFAWPFHALYYAAAGILWILPLKPLVRWMETGKWRE
jgi:Protein of unknown function (DUF2842)